VVSSAEMSRSDLWPPLQLDTILRSQAVARKFDLLSIDIETHDEEVLASLDLSEFQPELIVIEAHKSSMHFCPWPGPAWDEVCFRQTATEDYRLTIADRA
jgi:hypothetical protein